MESNVNQNSSEIKLKFLKGIIITKEIYEFRTKIKCLCFSFITIPIRTMHQVYNTDAPNKLMVPSQVCMSFPFKHFEGKKVECICFCNKKMF